MCELETSFQDAELSLSEPALYTEIIPLTSITLSNQKCQAKLYNGEDPKMVMMRCLLFFYSTLIIMRKV